jgi:type VI secretion system secreted protein Hcp
VAIADMFLKMQDVTGEATDADHKGEIEVTSWSWGMKSPPELSHGLAKGRVSISEVQIVKRVDQSSATLMGFLRNNKVATDAKLTVRKAGQTPLEYFTIELKNVRVTSILDESQESELVERLTLAFDTVKVTYTPQSNKGAKGGGAVQFETDTATAS